MLEIQVPSTINFQTQDNL